MRLPLIPKPAPLSLSMLKIDLFSSPNDNVIHGTGRKDGDKNERGTGYEIGPLSEGICV